MRGPVPINAEQLVSVRLVGLIQQPIVNSVPNHDGLITALPGQGGVLLNVGLGCLAAPWQSDHLELGASLRHPDPTANLALQVFSCVGNRATVLDGPGKGGEGVVIGKHGALLVQFPTSLLKRLSPGNRIAIESEGVGMRVEDDPSIFFHSCSPHLARAMLRGRDASGRLRVAVVRVLPPEAAGAGIGMPANRLNLDLQVDVPSVAARIQNVRLGDLVALEGQDHRYSRHPDPDWLAIGAIVHGRSVQGGHGLGMATLLTAPKARLALHQRDGANLRSLLGITWH